MKRPVCPVIIYHPSPHPNADKLVVCHYGDITFVTGLHPELPGYNEGDRGCWIPAGSTVPGDLAREHDYDKRMNKVVGEDRYVVGRANMRGVKSNGVYYGEEGSLFDPSWEEGYDAAEALDIRLLDGAPTEKPARD